MITLSVMPAGSFERKISVKSMSVIHENDMCENVLGNWCRLNGAEKILDSVIVLRIFKVKCKI